MRFPTYPVKHDQLSAAPRLGEGWRVYLALVALSADRPVDGELGRAGVVKISRARLAAATGLAPSYVSKVIQRLIAAGMIGADSHRGRETVYTVYPRWVPPVDSTPLPTRRAPVLSGEDNQVSSLEDNYMSSGADNSTYANSVSEPQPVLSDEDNSSLDMSTLEGTSPKESALRAHVKDAKTSSTLHSSKAPDTLVPDTSRPPLHPSERADWNHEGKPTEAHWRALEDLTWQTYGIATDRDALAWYDMNAWRRRMNTLTDARAS